MLNSNAVKTVIHRCYDNYVYEYNVSFEIHVLYVIKFKSKITHRQLTDDSRFNISVSGYVYTRWGSFSCPDHSEQIYGGKNIFFTSRETVLGV